MILEKPIVEMIRHMRPLYVRALFNGKPMSKVLVDNGSIVSGPYHRLGEERGCGTGLGLFNLLLGHLWAHFIYKSIRK